MSEFDLWGEIGTIYEDEAASAHRKVMELNRRFLNHWLRLGSLCEKKQKRQEAVQAYRRALELNGQNGRIWNELANVYFNAGAYEDAVEAYLKAIEMEPGYGWPYSNLGLAYTCLGRDGEAVPLHLKAVDLLADAVERGMVWNRLGNAYRRVGDYENAAQAYRLADELAPGKVDLRGDLGEIHNELFFEEDAPAEPSPTAPTSAPLPADHWLGASLNESEETLFGLGEADDPSTVEQAEPIELGGPKLQTTFEPLEEVSPVQVQDAAPAAAEPAAVEPAAVEPAAVEPVAVEPAAVEPAAAEPAAVEPAAVEPAAVEPVAVEPAVIEAAAVEPAVAEPAVIEAAAVEPAVAEPAIVEPAAVEPAAAEPAVSEPAAVEPTAVEDAVVEARAAELAGMSDAQSARVWNDLGEIYDAAGSDVEAIEAYRRAIELDPHFGWPYCNLATILARQGRYLDAIRLFQHSIEVLNDARDVAVVWKKLIDVTLAYKNEGGRSPANEPLG